MINIFRRLFVVLGMVVFLPSTLTFAYSVPEEVQNLRASEEDGKIFLEWDPGVSAEDVIIGYKIYYGVNAVQTEDDFYDDEVLTGAQTNYTFDSLEKGVEYFFAVTALDSQENESATYSKEISFTLSSPEPEVEEIPEPETPQEETPEEPVDEPDVISEPENSQGEVEAAEVIDTTPPAEATNILVDDSGVSNGKVVLLWNKSSDQDLDDQILFTKKGIRPWDGGVSIGSTLQRVDLEVEPNQNYQIKIVSVDLSGNQSVGVSKTFSTALAEAGGSSYLPLLLGVLFLIFLITSTVRR